MDFIFDPKLWSGHTTGRNLMRFELVIESDLLEVHAKNNVVGGFLRAKVPQFMKNIFFYFGNFSTELHANR